MTNEEFVQSMRDNRQLNILDYSKIHYTLLQIVGNCHECNDIPISVYNKVRQCQKLLEDIMRREGLLND